MKNMIKIEGVVNPIHNTKYEGSVFSEEDLNYALSLMAPVKELKMLYSGKRDGMTESPFHSKCDWVGNTLVLLKAENGHSCGAFAKPEWNSSNKYIRDDSHSCFLFTCRNKTKHTLTNSQYAIYCYANYGPGFGGPPGCDLCVYGNNKFCNYLGNAYSIPAGGKREDYLCGPHGATLEDYEVHQVIFQ